MISRIAREDRHHVWIRKNGHVKLICRNCGLDQTKDNRTSACKSDKRRL